MANDQGVPRPEERLSEADVSAVLARASDIEVTGQTAGLTVAELHEVAEQVGISSDALSRALSEVARSAPDKPLALRSWVRQRETSFVSGRVSDEDLAWFIRLLDQLGQIKSGVHYEKGGLNWRTPSGLHVEVLNRPHETYVSVEAGGQVHLNLAAIVFIGAGVALGAAAALIGAQAMPLATSIALGAAAGTLGLGVYWRLKVERARTAILRASAGISEVLRMVAWRSRDEPD